MRSLLFAVIAALALRSDAGEPSAGVIAKIEEAKVLRRAGRHAEAGRVADVAVSRARQGADPKLLLRAVSTRGDCRFYSLDYAGATTDFTEALAMTKRLGDRTAEVEQQKNLGITWAMRGRLDLALAHLHQSVEIAERYLPNGVSRSTHANLGTIYERLGARNLAIRSLRQALAPGPEPLTPAAEVDARARIGSLYLVAGEPDAAVPELRAALAAIDPGLSSVEQAFPLDFLVAAEIAVGDKEPALAHARRVADLHRQMGHWPQLRQALVRIGDLQTNRRAARAAYEEAAAISPEKGQLFLWLAKSRLARLEAEEGDRPRALAGYESAMDTLEQFIGGLSVDEGLSGIDANHILYEEWMDVLLPKGETPTNSQLDEAIRVFERARGSLVVWKPPSGEPGDDAAVLADRKREAADRLARMRGSASDIAADDLRREEMERLELELWRLNREPGHAAQPLPRGLLAALQARLASSEALLAYFRLHDEMLLFLITARTVELLRLPVTDRELTLRVEALLGRLSGGAGEGWKGMARRLHRDLMADALGRLPHDVRTLHIVTDGNLTGLPFEVLLAPGAAGKPEQPVISRYAVAYSESLSDLLTERQSQSEGAAGRLLVLHPGPAAALRSERDPLHALYRAEGFSASPLLHAEEEVRAITAALGPGAEVWRGKDAREAALTPDALVEFSALHFTTHGMVSRWSPWRSALLLSDGGEDGLLQAREIAERMPPCQLVVLAACRTAVGQSRAGREMRSLADAFQRAGARTVVASLWDVDDASTARLFAAFYRELAAGARPAEALQRAKLSLLASPATAAPHHWAGFLLYGDGMTSVGLANPKRRVIEGRSVTSRFTMLLVAGGGLLLALAMTRAARAP